MVLSQSVEDYLKIIYNLEEEGTSPSTSRIAEAMDVSSASATNMLKRLDKMGLVTYKSYKGATLTEAGKKIALEVIRHHRLLELYLLEVMGYSWDEVHDEAEKLEHHISEQFEEKIAELLDDPTHDPHGDPIPNKDLVMPRRQTIPLPEADEGKSYLISQVKDQDPKLLRYLEEKRLLPGLKVTIQEKAPFNGPVTLTTENGNEVIGRKVASAIFVTIVNEVKK